MQFMSLRNDFHESYRKYFSKTQEESVRSPIEHITSQLQSISMPIVNLQTTPLKSASISIATKYKLFIVFDIYASGSSGPSG